MGPIAAKVMINRRAPVKVYPLIFVFQALGAVHIEICHDYYTEAYLLQWSHFISCHEKCVKSLCLTKEVS